MRLLGNCARSLRWKSESGIGRTIATASTCSGLASARRRQVAMACSGSLPSPLQRMSRRTSLDSSIAATSSPSFRMAQAASPWSPPIPRRIMRARYFPHVAPVWRVASARCRVVGTVNFPNLAGFLILHCAGAGNEVAIAQPHFATRREAEELLRRIFAEIILFDVQDLRERHLARSSAGV